MGILSVCILLIGIQPVWFTGLLGLNSSFHLSGETTAAGPNGVEYPVKIYKGDEQYILLGSFREFPQCRFLLVSGDKLFRFDDSGKQCLVSEKKISIKQNAIRNPLEVTEAFKNICTAYTVEQQDGKRIFSLTGKDGNSVLRFSLDI